MAQDEKLEILTQLFQNLSESEKTAFLVKVAGQSVSHSDIQTTNTQTKSSLIQSQRKIIICPVCGSTHAVRNGWKCGTQRYLCRECGKSFGDTENTILKSTKKELDVWRVFIKCMIEKKSIRKCAEICKISVPTSFLWRHKILDALQNMMADVQLNGVVEADETFTAISYKGQKNRMPRKSHKRGTKASKRGLSEEKVCIPCGVNMNGLSIAKIANLGKPSWKDIKTVLGGKVEKGSVLVTDSFRGYYKLANEMEVTHIRIPRKKYTNGAFNIQLLNNYHSQLKEMINVIFNGVSTKYLNNYVYNNMVNFSNGDDNFKKNVMFKYTMTTKCKRTRKDIYNRHLIPIV